jgi:hypothetical protein
MHEIDIQAEGVVGAILMRRVEMEQRWRRGNLWGGRPDELGDRRRAVAIECAH